MVTYLTIVVNSFGRGWGDDGQEELEKMIGGERRGIV
jgi:hypothetical protein